MPRGRDNFDGIGGGDREDDKFIHPTTEKIELRSVGKDGEREDDTDMADGRVLKDYGETIKYDPGFKGPIHNRSCTDIICCFLFVLCVVGMVVVSFIGYARGDPTRLIYPTDSHGMKCGAGDLQDKPYLFFFDLVTCAKMGAAVVTGCPTQQVCVKQCPTENSVYLAMAKTDLICQYHVDHDVSPYKEMSAETLIKENLCASYYLVSKPIVKRCMPVIFAQTMDMAEDLADTAGQSLVRANGEGVTGGLLRDGILKLARFTKLEGTAELVFGDIVKSAHLIAVCLVIAMLLSMLWVVLLRWITIVMVWLTMFLFVGIFGFGTGYSYYRYFELKGANITEEYKLPYEMKFDFDYYLTLETTWLVFGCTGATIFIIFLLVIFFLCNRIMLAGKLISEASIAISKMWCVLAWPLFPFFAQISMLAYWVTSVAYLSSMGTPQFYNNGSVVPSNDADQLLNRFPCNPETNGTLGDVCTFVKYGGDQFTNLMLIYMLFMFFWVMNFISALEQMTLAGAFSSYYWAWDKDTDIPAFPLLASLGRSLRYHTGSLAFGALVLSIVQMIRTFLEYINRKLKDTDNSVAKFILKCLRCCFWCLEKFLRYVNKNAYIVIAVHGRSFCSAASDGFMLIMRNVIRTVVLDKVCDFVMLISKLMVTGAMGILAFLWFQGQVPKISAAVPDLNYFLAPVVIVVVGSYLIADSFFDVYSMAVDTLFICFLEDLERHDGSDARPYYMSRTKNLRSLLYKR